MVLLPLWRKAIPNWRGGQVGLAILTPFLYSAPFLYFIVLAIVASSADGESSTTASNGLTSAPPTARNVAPTPTSLFDSFMGSVQPTDVLHLGSVDIQARPLANAVWFVVDGSLDARQTCIMMQGGDESAINGYMKRFAAALAEATPVVGQSPNQDDIGLVRVFFGQACRARFVMTDG